MDNDPDQAVDALAEELEETGEVSSGDDYRDLRRDVDQEVYGGEQGWD